MLWLMPSPVSFFPSNPRPPWSCPEVELQRTRTNRNTNQTTFFAESPNRNPIRKKACVQKESFGSKLQQQQLPTNNNRSLPTMEDIDGKRKRSSSMDILAEAAATSISGQTSRSSTSEDEAEHDKMNKTEIPVRNDIESDVSPFRHFRPRSATISFSPYARKDPSFDYLLTGSQMNANKLGLNWLASAADDETATAELLSGLSNSKSLFDVAKDTFSFGNLNYAPVVEGLRNQSRTHEVSKDGNDNGDYDNGDDGDDDDDENLQNDVSLLTAVATKIINEDPDDEEFISAVELAGRARSNSMPQLPSTMTSHYHYFQENRPRSNSITKEYLLKHGFSASAVGVYTPEERKMRIERFLEKRRNRVWTKRVKYDVRKNFADSRVRVKGRFIRKEDEEELNNAHHHITKSSK